MNTNLIREMDKALALELLNELKIEKAIPYLYSYLDAIQNKIEQNSDNKKFIEDKKNTIEKFHEMLLHAAKTFFAKEEWLNSACACRELIKLKTNDDSVYKHASICYKNLKQLDVSLELLEEYARRNPNEEMLDVQFGEIYSEYKTKDYGYKAIEHYEKFLEKHPEDIIAFNCIGNIYSQIINDGIPRFDEQMEYYKKAYSINPKDKATLKHLSVTYSKKGEKAEARKYYRKFYKLYKDSFSHDEFFEYAAHLIAEGDFLKAWKYYDHRFLKETGATYMPEIEKEKWDGITDIKDKVLLIHAEQGFGDVIMYVRLVKLMKKYAKKVIFVVHNELGPLLLESDLGFDIYPLSQGTKNLEFDTYLPLISLPRVLQITPENIPFQKGYLTVDKERVQAYKKSFMREDKFNIGICFEGAVHGINEKRDVDWKYLNEFINIPNVQLYCLKKEKNKDDFKNILPNNKNIICLGDTWHNFADTAAAIKSMDLVISTDSAILNLAGALGVKTFALFNAHREYRWYGTEEGRNVWYSSVTPFQAKMQFAWDEVIERVKAATIEYMDSQRIR